MKTPRNTDQLIPQVAQKIFDLINSSDSILITAHVRMDGDAVGSCIALASVLRSAGKKVVLANSTPVPTELLFLCSQLSFESSPQKAELVDLVISLDCANAERLGIDASNFGNIPLINIDHHFSNKLYGDLNWIDSNASCVGVMLLDFFSHFAFPVTEFIATALFVSLMTDTGRFSYSNTNVQAFAAAQKLIELGANPASVANELYFKKSVSNLKFLGFLYNNLKFSSDESIAYISVRASDLKQFNLTVYDTEGFVDIPRLSAKSALAIFFLEIEEGTVTKISLRSKEGFNCSELAARFGGGGHKGAAGAKVFDTLVHAQKIVLEAALAMMNAEEGK